MIPWNVTVSFHPSPLLPTSNQSFVTNRAAALSSSATAHANNAPAANPGLYELAAHDIFQVYLTLDCYSRAMNEAHHRPVIHSTATDTPPHSHTPQTRPYSTAPPSNHTHPSHSHSPCTDHRPPALRGQGLVAARELLRDLRGQALRPPEPPRRRALPRGREAAGMLRVCAVVGEGECMCMQCAASRTPGSR